MMNCTHGTPRLDSSGIVGCSEGTLSALFPPRTKLSEFREMRCFIRCEVTPDH